MISATGSLTFALSRLARPATDRFDDIRLALVDRLIEASGREALDGAAWLDAWQVAATEVADRVMSAAEDAIVAAGSSSRFPAQRLELLKPTADHRAAFLNRLLAEGIPLEELEDAAGSDQLRGTALDETWHRMTRAAMQEQSRWARVAVDIDAWRRPWRPLVIGSLFLIAAVTVLAAMLGGIVSPPQWFEPVNDWFWGLPWPW